MEFSLVKFIYLLCLSISLVLGDGMIEVFKWKQMDYYNRGSASGNNGNVVIGPQPIGYKRPRPGADVVYPDSSYRFTKRETEKITSRNALPSTAARFNADAPRNTSTYIPYNNVPMGVTHFRGRMFITMPRRRTGIPSTLNVIHMARDGKKESPKLNAYPSYEINHLNPETLRPNPNGLVSVYRTSVDDCQRLWFIDTGMLEYPGNRMQIQRPSIWIIDLKTDRILQRFEIPQSIVDEGRGLASITVDVKPNHCENTYAYIPDLVYNRLYVYSLQQNHIWSFSHNYFNFDPLAGDLNVAGQTFRWDDGIFAITLGPRDRAYYRPAFFHAMASNNEFVVSTQVLQNETNAARGEHGDDFRLMGSRGVNKQSTMHEYDPRTGVIFYNEIQQNGIGCWNSKRPFGPETHGSVIRDAERMIYPSDLTIDEAGDIYVMSNTMPRFIYSTLDTNEYNFRVWKQNVFEAKRNTVCE